MQTDSLFDNEYWNGAGITCGKDLGLSYAWLGTDLSNDWHWSCRQMQRAENISEKLTSSMKVQLSTIRFTCMIVKDFKGIVNRHIDLKCWLNRFCIILTFSYLASQWRTLAVDMCSHAPGIEKCQNKTKTKKTSWNLMLSINVNKNQLPNVERLQK